MRLTTQDITCYKLLLPNLTSFYRGFLYRLDKFFQVDDLNRWAYEIKNFDEDLTYGFHSFQSKNITAFDYVRSKTRLFECTIPAGAEYIEGEDDEGNLCYLSNQIIIKQLMEQDNA